MSARFELVQTAAGWHARFRASNGRVVWTTEVYDRRRGAVRAIELICDDGIKESPFADWPEVRWSVTVLEVRDVDERPAPPAPIVLEPPYYDRRGFWHDRDFHWRFCYGDECVEAVPPAGTTVRGRLGEAIPDAVG